MRWSTVCIRRTGCISSRLPHITLLTTSTAHNTPLPPPAAPPPPRPPKHPHPVWHPSAQSPRHRGTRRAQSVAASYHGNRRGRSQRSSLWQLTQSLARDQSLTGAVRSFADRARATVSRVRPAGSTLGPGNGKVTWEQTAAGGGAWVRSQRAPQSGRAGGGGG